MDISKKILSDPVNKWVFSNAATETFLVGGYVRDLMRGQISKDKDYVLKNNAKSTAIKAAKKFNGTFVPLKPGQTYRVVLKTNEILDFSTLKFNIINDLKERDFTINAIAWSPKTAIIDHFGGREDLNNHIIKAVRIKNLLDDPLRIIRAYRIAAELGFKLEDKTKKYLKYYSKNISEVASERITEEFFKILSNVKSGKYLVESYKEKIIDRILIPHSFKKNKKLSNNIKELKLFESFLKTLLSGKEPAGEVLKSLDREISQGLNRIGLIRLALLLKDQNISFTRLNISKSINNAIKDIHKAFKKETDLKPGIKNISKVKIFEIFKISGNWAFETALMISFIKKQNIKKILKMEDEFMKLKKKNLLNGNEVQKILNVKPGAYIGKILSALKDEQIKGRVKSRPEARRWILANYT